MMCMKCAGDYVQQTSSARNTLNYFGAECASEHALPIESEISYTAFTEAANDRCVRGCNCSTTRTAN